MNNWSFLEERLAKAEQEGLTRLLPDTERTSPCRVLIGGKELVSFSSNDYLGLSFHPEVRQASLEAIEKWGSGSGSSRLMSGDHPLYHELESSLCRFKGREGALVFSSGYHANLALLTSTLGRGDHIFADRSVHASLIDGCLLSGARLSRFPHNDLSFLESELKKAASASRKAIVIEGLYSMDGDSPSLDETLQLAEKYDAFLFLDDAHGLGTMGECGQGLSSTLSAESRIKIAAETGTLSKALGSLGGFVLGQDVLIKQLINKGRTFLFTTALPPSALAAASAALNILEREPQLVKELQEKSCLLRSLLREARVPVAEANGPIIPILIGASEDALTLSQELLKMGHQVTPIRHPTVPQGSARLRISVNVHHSVEELTLLANAVTQLAPSRTWSTDRHR